MKIENHNLTAPASHNKKATKNKGGVITPKIIVLHYTASGGEDGSGDADYLSRATTRASAQVVVGREGDIHQLMPLNNRAWHAGESAYKGKSDVNSFSIGIEIDNWGWLNNEGYSHAGVKVPEEFQFKGTRNGPSLWEAYRSEQLEAVSQVIAAICDYYDIEDIVGHEDVSPGRKQDPGPALDGFISQMKKEHLKDFPVEGKSQIIPAKGTKKTTTGLNLRQDADKTSLILTTIPKGSSVEILKEPYPGWFQVRFGNRIGFVVGKYLT
jgi:N-acetylmuramoyl-L-alanine amidase